MKIVTTRTINSKLDLCNLIKAYNQMISLLKQMKMWHRAPDVLASVVVYAVSLPLVARLASDASCLNLALVADVSAQKLRDCVQLLRLIFGTSDEQWADTS